VFQSLIVALVLIRLEYCNSVLAGLPANLIQRLQSAQNAAARLIYRIRRYDHITDALISLHWLRVPERISFKIACPDLPLSQRQCSAPSYLSSYFARVADVPSRHRLRSASTSRLTTPFIRRSTIGKRSFPVVGAD